MLGWELGLGLGPGLSLGADLHPVDPQQPIQQGDRSGPLRFGDHRRGRRPVTGPEPLAGAGACVLTDARLGLAKLVDASFEGKQPRPAGQIARGEGTAGSDVHQRKGHASSLADSRPCGFPLAFACGGRARNMRARSYERWLFGIRYPNDSRMASNKAGNWEDRVTWLTAGG